jgi:hypothetical protein
MITKLNTTLTLVTGQIDEATLSIQEIDKSTTVIANYTDAANKSKNEFTTIVTIKTSTLDYNGERYLSSIINCVIFRL